MNAKDALAELEDIVTELEQGDSALDESIARFERGVALSRRCEDRLGEAEKKLAVLLKQGTQIVEVDMESQCFPCRPRSALVEVDREPSRGRHREPMLPMSSSTCPGRGRQRAWSRST